jgi:hypothetical protein
MTSQSEYDAPLFKTSTSFIWRTHMRYLALLIAIAATFVGGLIGANFGSTCAQLFDGELSTIVGGDPCYAVLPAQCDAVSAPDGIGACTSVGICGDPDPLQGNARHCSKGQATMLWSETFEFLYSSADPGLESYTEDEVEPCIVKKNCLDCAFAPGVGWLCVNGSNADFSDYWETYTTNGDDCPDGS